MRLPHIPLPSMPNSSATRTSISIPDYMAFIVSKLTLYYLFRALSTMILLEVPHVNVLTKFDMLSQSDKDKVHELLDKSPSELICEIRKNLPKKFKQLNEALIMLVGVS